jgi:nanoRNase/pAp phosphatase (c-di-AMP/oligoRNAs hydrolase)
MDRAADTEARRIIDTSAPADKAGYSNIANFLEAHRDERHVVVVHDFPDPDAISSAFAHRLISRPFGIETSIIYRGKISHQQNVALIRLLDIEPVLYTPEMDLNTFDGAVFIDNQGTNCKEIVDALEAAGVPTLAVVDHHDRQERLSPEFSDIRRVGATATIYAGYLEQGLVEMDRSDAVHATVATALMHGLMTDTNNFIRANEKDFYAAAFLSQFRDANVLVQIMSQTRSKTIMEIIRQALGNRTMVESFSIAGIGFLRAEDRDAIPQAADFLLTEENVHTAIAYGIVTSSSGEEKLTGSLRTVKMTLGPDEFLKDVFGRGADGHYLGGGKELAGGFEIPIGFLSGENSDEYRQLKWQVYDHQIKQKLFAKIGVKQMPVETLQSSTPDDLSPTVSRRPGRS